jgi:hypothetical protein
VLMLLVGSTKLIFFASKIVSNVLSFSVCTLVRFLALSTLLFYDVVVFNVS